MAEKVSNVKVVKPEGLVKKIQVSGGPTRTPKTQSTDFKVISHVRKPEDYGGSIYEDVANQISEEGSLFEVSGEELLRQAAAASVASGDTQPLSSRPPSRFDVKNKEQRKIFGVPDSDKVESSLRNDTVGSRVSNKTTRSAEPINDTVSGVELGEDFSLEAFSERVIKFLTLYKDTLDPILKLKDHAKMRNKILPFFSKSFSSSRVRIDIDNFIFLVKDYMLLGDFSLSPIYDNIQDIISARSAHAAVPNSRVEELVPSERGGQASFMPLGAAMSPNVDSFFSGEGELESYTPVPAASVSVIENVAGSELNILDSACFETCKNFKCSRYQLFSVAEFGVKLGKKPTKRTSTLFKVSCASKDSEVCPQRREYSAEEQEFYEIAMGSGNSKESAHNMVMSLRVRRLAK